MTDADQEKMLEKVRRLFELAKSSNQFESEAAAAKAQELLFKYNLDMGMLAEKEVPYVKVEMKLKNRAKWAGTLLNTIGRANGCFVVHMTTMGDQYYNVVGQRHSIEVMEYSYQQMEKRIRWLSEVAWDIYLGDDPEGMYKESFCFGAVDALKRKLDTQVKMQTTAPESKAVVLKQDAALMEAVKGWFPALGYSRRQTVSGDGWYEGKRAGNVLNVNPGLHGGGKGQRRLG